MTIACTARPSSRITRHRVDRHHRLTLAGRASERRWTRAGAQVQRSQRSVLVDISRSAARGCCRFVTAGRPPLSTALLPPGARAPCARDLALVADAPAADPRGRYLVTVVAFDARAGRQRVGTYTHIRFALTTAFTGP